MTQTTRLALTALTTALCASMIAMPYAHAKEQRLSDSEALAGFWRAVGSGKLEGELAELVVNACKTPQKLDDSSEPTLVNLPVDLRIQVIPHADGKRDEAGSASFHASISLNSNGEARVQIDPLMDQVSSAWVELQPPLKGNEKAIEQNYPPENPQFTGEPRLQAKSQTIGIGCGMVLTAYTTYLHAQKHKPKGEQKKVARGALTHEIIQTYSERKLQQPRGSAGEGHDGGSGIAPAATPAK